jgi:OmpA-OmpF porin, OOP family
MDHDGIVDRLDRCPTVSMGIRGREGCPLAHIEGNKIVILDQVYFLTDQDIILPESRPLLEEVALQLRAHPEVRRLVVEAHTDARATDAYNFDLSRRRAASVVRFLRDSGIAANRLCSVGYGCSRPVVANDSESDMALNRRVEFNILPVSSGVRPPCPFDPAGAASSSKAVRGRATQK